MAATTIDEYLAGVPDPQRGSLEQLRAQIRAAAPRAVEGISYGIPAFKLKERWFAGLGVAGKGCSFYAGAAPIEACRAELAGYRLRKGTITFRPDRPLPAELVTKLVRLRIAEYGLDD